MQRVAWPDTTRAFHGFEVEIKTTRGERLRGAWLSTTTDSFELESHDRTTSYPRSIIQSIRIRRRRVRGRVIGTTAGYVGSASLVGERMQGRLAFLVLGVGALGFIVGRELDRASTEVLLYDPPK